jgi:hypothetical protein
MGNTTNVAYDWYHHCTRYSRNSESNLLELARGLVRELFPNSFSISFFFLEAFGNISHRLGGITPLGVFSDAFPGLKMWVTFACATANFLTHFIFSIAVLENVPPDAGLQKNATFPH